MSGHPRERLSALLDGELGPAEQAELQAHLAACAACAAELEELALVGQAARELDEPAPEGYFDELPARVRQRLRAARPATPAPRRRLTPTWSWAAAAAVLVGVLLPVLWQRQAEAPLPASAPATATAPRPQADAAAKEEQAAGGPAFQARSPYEAEAKTRAQAAPAAEKPRALPATPAPPAASEPALDQATPGFAPAPAAARPVPAQPAEAEHELAAAGEADGRLSESVTVADAAPTGGSHVPEPRRQAARDDEGPREEQAAPQTAASAESRKKIALGRSAGENQEAPGKQKGDTLGGLAARTPATAAEARELAREWQRQAERQRDPAQADEARLLALEALATAFRLSGSAADRTVLEKAVAAYAARPDAAQKRRAAGLLEPR